MFEDAYEKVLSIGECVGLYIRTSAFSEPKVTEVEDTLSNSSTHTLIVFIGGAQVLNVNKIL